VEKDKPEVDAKRVKVADLLAKWRDDRGRWAKKDFGTIQAVVLTAQITSLLSAVLIGFSKDWETWQRMIVAFISAAPAFCISIERAFDFPARHRLNGEAHYHFQAMLSRLEQGADPWAIESEFNKYQIEFEKRFPAGSVTATQFPKIR
jgi:hypothetical protein